MWPVLAGEEGDLHAMVGKEVDSYFRSEEGSGAWKSALAKFMLVRGCCFPLFSVRSNA